MFVDGAQKFFTYAGYYGNALARQTARDIERLTRPMPEEGAYKRVFRAIFSVPFVAALFIPSQICYLLAALGRGRFELLQPPEKSGDFWKSRSVKVISLNACFQDPWSPFTGGVVPPFEKVAGKVSRIAALVNAAAEESPAIFLGQEFENIGAQDECIRLMREKGFRYFLRDLGSNDSLRNNSGLFVASKIPLENIEFKPYPIEDRSGLAKWSQQGALTFTVSTQGKDLRLINVHLNYGEGEENQAARNRQLTRHIVPLLNKGPSILFGDLNFDTAKVDRSVSGLFGFVNALEGTATCSDEGKHTLRGKNKPSEGCADCQEKIDGVIYDPNRIELLNCETRSLRLEQRLLSDHYAIIATV